MSLEFRLEFSRTAVAIAWIFIFASYICQVLYSLRLIEILILDNLRNSLPDRAGRVWWPSHWNIPTAFYHVLYLVAPPTELQKGQVDMMQEMRDLALTGGGGPEGCQQHRRGQELGLGDGAA